MPPAKAGINAPKGMSIGRALRRPLTSKPSASESCFFLAVFYASLCARLFFNFEMHSY